MMRFSRVVIVTVAVFILAWVIKEVMGDSEGKKAEDLIEKIRLSGI